MRVSWRGARVAPRSAPRVPAPRWPARRRGCRAAGPVREDGRIVVSFWYAYGDLVRKVLLDLVARFNASQSRITSRPCTRATTSSRSRSCARPSRRGPRPRSRTWSSRSCRTSRAPESSSHSTATTGRGRSRSSLRSRRAARSRPRPASRSSGFRSTGRRRSSSPTGASWSESARRSRAPGRSSRDVAARLTRRDDDGEVRWGFEVPISWWYWVAMVGQAGGRARRARRAACRSADAAGEEALRFWQRLVGVDRVMRPPPGRDYQAWQSTNESFLRERVAMMWSSTAYVRYLEGNARFPVVAAPLPRHVRASVPTGGTMFVLMRAAPDEEKRAAWEFVRWMCEAEQTIAWSTRTGYMPVTRPAVERLDASAAGTRATRTTASPTTSSPTVDTVAVGARSLPRRARRRRAAPRGGRAHRARRRARSWPRRAPRRRGPGDAALAMAPVGDARPDAGAARRLLRRAHRRRRVREPLLVGPAHARRATSAPRTTARSSRTASSCASRCGRSATARSSSLGTMSLGLALALLRRPARALLRLRARERLQRVRRQLGRRRAALDVVLDAFERLHAGAPGSLLGDPRWALPALAFVGVWKLTGYAMIVFLAGLQAVPRSLLEAAALDGAGRVEPLPPRDVAAPRCRPPRSWRRRAWSRASRRSTSCAS